MRQPTDVPASLKNIDIKAVLRRRGVYLEQKVNKQLKEAVKPLVKGQKKAKAVEPTVPQRAVSYSNDIVVDYWQKQVRVVEVVEAKFEKKIEQYINTVTKQFLAHLDIEVGTKKTALKKFKHKDYFDDNEDALLTQAQIDFAPLLENVAVIAGQNANKLIGISEPYLPFNYRSQIASNVEKFTKSMLSTDKDTLTKIITDGLANGLSVPDIRAKIETTFSDYSRMQAQRITRTEVIRASNQASLDAFQQSGIVEGKQWLTFGADDECADYEGDVVTLSGSFYGSDGEFQDGDPPLHPNCKCVIIPVVV
jgi:SPP1 gp7 family putative phage head morphogenesis protein